MVMLQHPAEGLTAGNLPIAAPYFLSRLDDLVIQALVVAFAVVVLQERNRRSP